MGGGMQRVAGVKYIDHHGKEINSFTLIVCPLSKRLLLVYALTLSLAPTLINPSILSSSYYSVSSKINVNK